MFSLKYLFLTFKCSAPLATCYNHFPRVNKGHLFCYYLFYLDVTIFYIIIFKVATGVANLSDLRSIHGAIVLYKNILSLLYDTYFNSNLQAIGHLLMEEFNQLDGLFTELDTAVGQLISEYSVMEGYSNTADEIKERLDDNATQVDELRDLYRCV